MSGGTVFLTPCLTIGLSSLHRGSRFLGALGRSPSPGALAPPHPHRVGVGSSLCPAGDRQWSGGAEPPSLGQRRSDPSAGLCVSVFLTVGLLMFISLRNKMHFHHCLP